MSVQGGELYEYGIQTEHSDIRAHVSPLDKTVYVFKTKAGLDAIEEHKPPLKPAWQLGVTGKTADGWPVKIGWIRDVRHCRFESWPRWSECNESLPPGKKGSLAVACVLEMMKLGRFPLWINASEDDNKDIQIQGTDILVFCHQRIQVKCDFPSARTGNLYLQHAERNPLGIH